MKIRIHILIVLISCATLFGCSTEGETTETGNSEEITTVIDHIDAEEVLTLSPDADIFQFNAVIYQTNIDWVDELSLSPQDVVGEIQAQNETSTDFEDEMANKIPVGTKIYSAKDHGDMLMVEVDGEWRNYYAIVEG
ncbi:hypothetical protein [Alkalicoccobacillus porphyridii]|uniref:Uncharacterized protein n=1 Tax=Alkalicoccobacillus porphyridii TaxID=2597270 RepID=A0A554A1V4_9BACI|nr:hypothetical protein [Alkalicoccobacillus porphyridii]TSB47665.1 hypothetical protein FN960_03860 [Alkalicoccobacillus porphyridii]